MTSRFKISGPRFVLTVIIFHVLSMSLAHAETPDCRSGEIPSAWRACRQSSDCVVIKRCCDTAAAKKFELKAKSWVKACDQGGCDANCLPARGAECKNKRCTVFVNP